MPTAKIKEYLDQRHVKYISITHSPAYTSQEIAATAHIPGKNLAKTVVVKIDGKMTLVVLPASNKIDFNRLKNSAGAQQIELANESEFVDRFPGCETGAMPPLGELFGMEVLASEELAEDDEIAFNAGTHRELVQVKYQDFTDIVKPRMLSF
ncbi:MAG: YbaK/EbsC family protein [Candidatus Omnitrophica bacterium]|nr:YbaK/EbsC family protein [Candidatus Omnitrophota bacterium]